MGLTKQYLRYAPQAVFNIVGSGRGGAVYLDAKGGLETELLWNILVK